MELEVDYPVRPRARYGWGTPSHPRLEAMVAAGVDRYRSVLQRFLVHRDALGTITADAPRSVEEPYWTNGFIPGLDGVALYSFVADQRPASNEDGPSSTESSTCGSTIWMCPSSGSTR